MILFADGNPYLERRLGRQIVKAQRGEQAKHRLRRGI
jgi:hypothetical protein